MDLNTVREALEASGLGDELRVEVNELMELRAQFTKAPFWEKAPLLCRLILRMFILREKLGDHPEVLETSQPLNDFAEHGADLMFEALSKLFKQLTGEDLDDFEESCFPLLAEQPICLPPSIK